jgi:hypothetical protein
MPDVSRGRLIGFSLVAVLCLGFATFYAIDARRRALAAEGTGAPGLPVVDNASDLARVASIPHVMFRSTALGKGYGRLALARLDDHSGPRYVASLECDRVDFSAGRGVCLTADRGVYTTYSARLFDSSFQTVHTIALNGVPSRTRVAPNGRLAAITVFVSGHSYAAAAFSTQTTLIDATSGTVLADLEQFQVTDKGVAIKQPDFNFWGVTFTADSNRFYATLGTGGKVLLVEGDVTARTAKVLRDAVECPSLSPDGTRLGFKKRVLESERLMWRLAVLDLRTMSERVLAAEQRSIDDQVEWLDDRHLLYSAPDEETGLSGTSVWALDVDGGTPAVRWLRGGYSPSVVRQ